MRYRSIAVAATALLAACSIGPEYQRPAVDTPAAWKEHTAAEAAGPSPVWWQGFRAPELDALMQEAQAHNFDIAAAVARVRQAEAQEKIAGAPLLPSVQASVSESRSRGTSSSARTGGSPQGVTIHSGVLSASYDLDFWGRNADALESAQASLQATRFDWQTITLTVQSDLANAFFTVAALQERLRLAGDNLRNAEQTLEAVRAREAAGTAAGLDVAQQESIVAELRAVIPPLDQQLRQNVNALALLTGRLPENIVATRAPLDSLVLPAVAPGLPSTLLQRRPDIASAEAQLVAANADVKAAEAALFPNISLTAQGGLASTALSSLFDPGSVLYSVAASAVQPIFQGGALEGEIEFRRARYDELVQNYRKAIVASFGDVENALSAVELTAREDAAEQAALQTARRAYEISQGQLYSGAVDILTVLNTQRALFAAEDLAVQAKLARLQAIVSLFKALGGGWQPGGEQRAEAGAAGVAPIAEGNFL